MNSYNLNEMSEGELISLLKELNHEGIAIYSGKSEYQKKHGA